MPRTRPIYICVEGVLTNDPDHAGGVVRKSVLDKVRELCKSGVPIILWSSAGADYAKKFAAENYLSVSACLDKPGMIVDEKPSIRPKGKMPILSSKQFVGWDFNNFEDEWDVSNLPKASTVTDADGLASQVVNGIVDALENDKAGES
jgi:hypothetical protein